jgi:hypothetical protein
MRSGITAASVLFALAIGAGVALGDVAVYSNDFPSKASVADLQKVDGGRECARGWVKAERRLALEISGGEVRCVFATPVRGDTVMPAHALEVEATIPKGPSKSIRDDLVIVLGVRGGSDVGYELRIVPATRAWELRRDPEGAGFPQVGSDQAIAGIGRLNRIALQAFGDRVTASVNGKVLVDGIADPAAGQVDGRSTTLGLLTDSEVRESVVATFDDLEVSIPDVP